jgi:hypothetical protein
MAISRAGVAGAEATSLTIPAHQVGDLIILAVYRIGSTVAPTKPSERWRLRAGPTGANSMSRTLAFKWAESTSEVTGTWTNATILQCGVYRSSSGLVVPGQLASVINASSSSLAFGALSYFDDLGASWAFGSACINQTDTDIETGITGFDSIGSTLGSTGEAAIYDTNGAGSSFSSISRTLSGTAGNLARMHIELIELPYAVSGSSNTGIILGGLGQTGIGQF